MAIDYAVGVKSSLKLKAFLFGKKSDKLYNKKELRKLFASKDFKELDLLTLHHIKTGMYLAAFRGGDLGDNGDAIMSDYAPQFDYIYSDHGLCWIHELRHYKLIEALCEENKIKLENFVSSAWKFFRIIKLARNNLTSARIKIIFKIFESVFGKRKTGFKALDKQRAFSYLKAEKLLAPLWNKILPMHNNSAELDVRGKVIKRKFLFLIRLREEQIVGIFIWDFLKVAKN